MTQAAHDYIRWAPGKSKQTRLPVLPVVVLDGARTNTDGHLIEAFGGSIDTPRRPCKNVPRRPCPKTSLETDMKRVNVGFVGFGFIGKVHAFGYHNLPLYYDPPPVQHRFHTVCTSRPETAERARALLGFERAVTDFREVTEDPDIDVVHICTPNRFHRDAVLSAMEHQKHIYCDKPLTATLDEAREIERALPGYEGVHQMTLQSRFFPATLRARELVDEGFLGEVLSFRAAYLHSGSANPEAPLKWKLSRDLAGGGVLLDLGTHVIDIVRHLVGEFSEVFCVNKVAFPDRPSVEDPARRVPVEAEDLSLMTVRTQGGALGTIEATKIATGAQDELRFEIHGTRGALRFNLMLPNYLEAWSMADPTGPHGGEQGWKAIDTVQRFPKPGGWPTPKASIGWLRGHVHCLYNFLTGVAAGERVGPGLEVGIRLQEIADAAYRSDTERAWVSV